MEVMIIRLKDNNELISFVEGIYEDKIKTMYPHYIKYFTDNQSLGIMPYCPLSDHASFDIDLNRVEFMVIPKKVIERKYIDMVKEDIDEAHVDFLSVPIENKSCIVINGNQTQH